MQRLVGAGGTLWIVVSERVAGATRYSLKFCFVNCRRHTYPRNVGFGKYSVVGDKVRSRVFPSKDASHLLLSLRFSPNKPIDHPRDRLRAIGQSLQTVRKLNSADVRLLKEFARQLDRWSVFISYHHRDARHATELSRELERRGVPAFRDSMSIGAGVEWWPAIERAVQGARLLVVLLGKEATQSRYIPKEIAAARARNVPILPVRIAGGRIEDLDELDLGRLHAVHFVGSEKRDAAERIVARAYAG